MPFRQLPLEAGKLIHPKPTLFWIVPNKQMSSCVFIAVKEIAEKKPKKALTDVENQTEESSQ